MDLGMQGKVVVITGGGTGIGKAAAAAFLREGCKAALCGRRESVLAAAAAELDPTGGTVWTQAVDVTDYDAMQAFADAVIARFGRIDIWINNAGINFGKDWIDSTPDDFRRMLDTNLVAVFSGCKIAQRYMREQGGVILNAGSFTSLDPTAGRGAYSASKAAVLSLTRTFAAELAPWNIRVVAFVPGMIRTEMTTDMIAATGEQLLADIPARRFGTPEDLAGMLVFLASDAASYVNGTHVNISGGKRCVQNPSYAYKK